MTNGFRGQPFFSDVIARNEVENLNYQISKVDFQWFEFYLTIL